MYARKLLLIAALVSPFIGAGTALANDRCGGRGCSSCQSGHYFRPGIGYYFLPWHRPSYAHRPYAYNRPSHWGSERHRGYTHRPQPQRWHDRGREHRR